MILIYFQHVTKCHVMKFYAVCTNKARGNFLAPIINPLITHHTGHSKVIQILFMIKLISTITVHRQVLSESYACPGVLCIYAVVHIRPKLNEGKIETFL